MRIVLDANVIVAAFATRGLCAALFEYCVENHEIFLCGAMLKELTRVLRKRIKVPRSTVDEIESYLKDNISLVKPAEIDPGVCRDKKDLPVLGCFECVCAIRSLPFSESGFWRATPLTAGREASRLPRHR